jgi:orotidine-5'-phosphate decarboxylase
VTVLTSYDDADAAEAGYALPVAELVARRAGQAAEAGIDGIVCSAAEAEAVRARIGTDRAIVTPGIRPAGAEAGDQKRVMTPGAARRIGIDHVVVGRPITQAADPRAVAQGIVAEML